MLRLRHIVGLGVAFMLLDCGARSDLLDESDATSGGNGGGASHRGGCPSLAPISAASCDGLGSLVCTYLDCAAKGQTTATCLQHGGAKAAWSVETSPCAPSTCENGAATCDVGQICVVREGGALITDCVENPCGAGPITCSCAGPACGGTCTGVEGITVTCDTCSGGECP